MFSLDPSLAPFRYTWQGVGGSADWIDKGSHWCRELNETKEDLANDSRWPAFFPSPIAIVTVKNGESVVVEKVVGPSIVNRFPYIAMLSFCHKDLSQRHYSRSAMLEEIQRTGEVSIQFLPPGETLQTVMEVIQKFPAEARHTELNRRGVQFRERGSFYEFAEAFMAYRGKLVPPLKDFDQENIYSSPFDEVGSHTLCYFEIVELLLEKNIAEGKRRIQWRSIPDWLGFKPSFEPDRIPKDANAIKGYSSHYQFPSSATVAFESDGVEDNMAIKKLARLPSTQQRVDNDKARWPCFFPSSVGLITLNNSEGKPSLMPCGSTTMISRAPLTVGVCVSYAKINERYAPRASLDLLRDQGAFGCAVPFIDADVEQAIRYCGNVSVKQDAEKALKTGFTWNQGDSISPRPTQAPVFFDCKIVGERRLGTHFMFLGEVRKIFVHKSVSPEHPLEWYPFAGIGG